MKRKYKILFGVLAALICAGVGAFYLLRPVSVLTAPVQRGTLAESVTEQGALVPLRGVTVTADITGKVESVPFSAGQTVAQGETLLVIDASTVKREMENQIKTLKLQQSAVYAGSSSTKAELNLRREQLSQQLNTAKQEYERLYGLTGTSEELLYAAELHYEQLARLYRDARRTYGDFDMNDDGISAYRTEVAALRSQLSAAEQTLILAKNSNADVTRAYYQDMIASCEAQLAALDQSDSYAATNASATAQQLQITIDDLNARLGRGTLPAPTDATVWRVLVGEGDFVSENDPVAMLYGGEGLRLEVMLLASDALALRPGDTAECRFADGTTATATVTFISPIAQEEVSTLGLPENRSRVELSCDVLPENAGAGHPVDLTFSFVAASDVLSVPASSLMPNGDGSAVYVLQDGKAVLVPVQTGLQRGGRVEVLTGLAEGAMLILDPYAAGVKDGVRASAAAE